MKYFLSLLLTFLLCPLHAQKEAWREEYRQVMNFYEGLAAVWHNNGKWGFVNEKGKLVIPIEFDGVDSFDDGVCRVVNNNLYGLIDKKGKFIVPYKYKFIGFCLEGCLSVRDATTGKEGFIDKIGKIVVPLKYDAVDRFFDGLAWVYKKNIGCGYVNATGKEVIPLQYDYGWAFERGVTSVKKNNKWAFINKKNEPLTPFKYDNAGPFVNGFSIVTQKDHYGFVNTQGKEIIPLIYENVKDFSEGLAAVKKDGKWGYIDTTGKVVIPFTYSSVDPFDDEGTAVVSRYDAIFVIDKTGKCVQYCEELERISAQKPKKGWQTQYEFVGEPKNGVIVVGNNAQQGLVNKQGKVLIPIQYSRVTLVNKIALVRKDQKEGAFSLKGEPLVPPIYDMLTIEHFDKDDENSDFVFFTRREIYFGVLSKKGKVIVPEEFYNNVDTKYLKRGTIRVFRNDKVGLYNLEGKQLLPMIFDSIEPFVYENDNETEVVFEGKSFHIDKTGKCIRDCQNAPKY